MQRVITNKRTLPTTKFTDIPEHQWFLGKFSGYDGLFFKPSNAALTGLIHFPNNSNSVTWSQDIVGNAVIDYYQPVDASITANR
jgi:hypothetical protein